MRRFGDGLLSLLVLGGCAVVALRIVAPAPNGTPPVDESPGPRIIRPPGTIEAFADAIAIAEGYYAPGRHDGRSLPYAANNPGALKKPALGAADLPTWAETGVVIFPTEEMGWAALHHQICTMLTRSSRIYEPTDTLLEVGRKYADNDQNWGVNVAAGLGVPPTATLAELAAATSPASSEHATCLGTR
jgi:hypothetical protein